MSHGGRKPKISYQLSVVDKVKGIATSGFGFRGSGSQLSTVQTLDLGLGKLFLAESSVTFVIVVGVSVENVPRISMCKRRMRSDDGKASYFGVRLSRLVNYIQTP